MWWRPITHSMHWEWMHYPQWTLPWHTGIGGGLGHQDNFFFFFVLIYFSFLSLRGKKKWKTLSSFSTIALSFLQKKKKKKLLLSHFFRGIVIHMCKGLIVSMEITIYRNKPLRPYQTKE
jgi:hypothetical protein